MSNNKQSSIEWQFNELTKFFHIESEYKNTNDILIKAKEMHKEEIIKAVVWFDETDRRPCEIEKDAEQYYEQTYGGNK
jgi:hypothetical protein